MNSNELSGKTALVTGASKGLGRAMSLALAAAGARVILVSRDARLLDETAALIRKDGGIADTFPADVSDESQVLALERSISEKIGKIHILINNAGINLRKPVTEFTLDEWNRIQSTNVTSVFLMVRSFLPHMKQNGWGRIINITSMMSHVSLPGRTAYSTSKAGLIGMTKALALEVAGDNITVNGISPGPCETEINRPLFENPELSRQFLAKIPVGRWGKPAEVGDVAVFLCSKGSGFITGTDIVIDGGWLAQ